MLFDVEVYMSEEDLEMVQAKRKDIVEEIFEPTAEQEAF